MEYGFEMAERHAGQVENVMWDVDRGFYGVAKDDGKGWGDWDAVEVVCVDGVTVESGGLSADVERGCEGDLAGGGDGGGFVDGGGYWMKAEVDEKGVGGVDAVEPEWGGGGAEKRCCGGGEGGVGEGEVACKGGWEKGLGEAG